MPEPSISITIENSRPVELIDLTQGLLALADEYKRFVLEHGGDEIHGETKLYVNQIRSGSIIAELASKASPYMPFLTENFEHIPEYVKYLHEVCEFLLGKRERKQPLKRVNYENCMNIMEPVAKDGGSQFIIGAINVNAPITFKISSMEANAIQNAARREIQSLNEPVTGFRSQVLLYWFQARNDLHSNAGDRAIIESIYPNPVKVIFGSEEAKAKMLQGVQNPFRTAYIVDVAVETINGKPAMYKILAFHDTTPKE